MSDNVVIGARSVVAKDIPSNVLNMVILVKLQEIISKKQLQDCKVEERRVVDNI